jgi:hypothetical protein
MNQAAENDTNAIRSQIDTTRRRMDDTMEALGDRLKGRHLFDEVLGLFRSDNPNHKAMEIRDKVSRSASTAARSVVDTVKSNPVPALLIGAGIAWMIYSSRKSGPSLPALSEDEDYDFGAADYDPGAHYDPPLEYPVPASPRGFGEVDDGFSMGSEGDPRETNGESELEQVKVGLQGKASDAKQPAEEKLANLGDRVRQKTHAAGQRIREAGSRVQARTREVYVQARDRVAETADQHPLEVGLACLAAGVAVGLALPTPEKLNQVAGPTMDRLRQRTRDAGGEILQKGKRVVNAAGTAFQNEAKQQGLTFDGLREKAGAVADRTTSAATEAAQQEGMMPGAEARPAGGMGGDADQQREPPATPAPAGENLGRGI